MSLYIFTSIFATPPGRRRREKIRKHPPKSRSLRPALAPIVRLWRSDRKMKIVEVNKRRTKSDNVSVEFYDEQFGETRGVMVAEKATYGADRLWCMLEPIPVELDADSDSDPPPDDEDDEL